MRGLGSMWLMVIGLMLSTVISADPPLGAQAEISFLLTEVAKSDCKFYRNGKWYDGKRAAAHLRDKYGSRLDARGTSSAEEFIETVATRSSLSGKAYAIRCTGSTAVPSAMWFRERLAAYRQSLK